MVHGGDGGKDGLMGVWRGKGVGARGSQVEEAPWDGLGCGGGRRRLGLWVVGPVVERV